MLKECLDVITRRLQQDGQSQRGGDYNVFGCTRAMSEEFPAGDAGEVDQRHAGREGEYLAFVEVGARCEDTHAHRKQKKEQEGKPGCRKQGGERSNDEPPTATRRMTFRHPRTRVGRFFAGPGGWSVLDET